MVGETDMTEEKAEDTLRMGIEKLLEKEGASYADAIKAMGKGDIFFDEEGTSCAYARHADEECLMLQFAEMTLPHVHEFIKWLQDNFLPKGNAEKNIATVTKCYLKPRDGDDNFCVAWPGVCLDGYAVIPLEDYTALGGKIPKLFPEDDDGQDK
jgi:hypothetical protein